MQRSKTHAELNIEHSTKKARKIIAVLRSFKDLSKCSVLDIGTGSGVIAGEVAKISKYVTSIDIADDRLIKKGFKFKKVKSETIPFKNQTFDVVITNHVIEHIPKHLQRKHLQEIKRVMRKGGICYLATPNRYFLIGEEHRIVYFSFGKIRDISHLTYGQLVDYAKGLEPVNMAAEIIKNPEKYRLDAFTYLSFLKFLPEKIIEMFTIIFPTNIIIFKKVQ